MSAPAVAVTTLATPPVGPSDFRGALAAGGSIPFGQSRWYRLVAIDTNAPGTARRHSPPSVEIGPFTSTWNGATGNGRVVLNWSAVGGALAYRVYFRTDAAPNPNYDETVPNALVISASSTWATGTGTTFTDQVAAPAGKRPFFPVGLPRAVLTGGDAGTPGTFRTFYDAILAAAPACAAPLIPATFSPDVTGAYFALSAYLEIGDGATATYFLAKDTCLFLIGAIKTVQGAGCTFILGEYDAATGRRSRGCSIYAGGYGTATLPGGGASAGAVRIAIQADVCELNDSYVEDIGRKGMVQVTGNGVLSCGSEPDTVFGDDTPYLPITMRGTELAGLNWAESRPFQIVAAEVNDVFLRTCYAGNVYSTQADATFRNLVVEECVLGAADLVSSNVQRFIGLRVLGRSEADLYFRTISGTRRMILRDAVFGDAANDEDPILRQGNTTGTGHTLEWESLIEVELINAQGAPVSGKTVSILDSAGAVLASGVTDATGVVVGGMPVSYLIYTSLVTGALAAALMSAHVAAAKWSKTDRRPLTIRISGSDGVEAFTLPFSPTGSVRYRLKLHPENACNIAGQVEVIEFGGVVGASEIAMVVGQEDVGGGVTTIEEI